MIINNTLTEIGDVLIIYSQVVISSKVKFTNYQDEVEGVNSNRFFIKKFRFSFDGLNYSEWIELNDSNLQNIEGTSYGLLFFEFRYERSGGDNSGVLVFKNVKLFGDVILQIVNNTSTLDSIFEELSNNDFYTQAVRNNLLRKIYHAGILPKFIERGQDVVDNDFISLWSAVCIFISYCNAFADNFENILFKRKYLAEYLKQNNIQFDDKEITYNLLYFLSSNFYDEIRKRGTSLTYKKQGTKLINDSITQIDGEWLRLLCRNHYDEFLLEIIQKEHSGFCIGKSSPNYNGTYFSKQLNKTEENESDFIDLSKYTIIGNPSIQNEDGKNCLLINSDSGLGFDLDNPDEYVLIEKLINIDEEVDYEMTFNFLRKSGNSNLKVGIICYNRNGVILHNSTIKTIDGLISNKILDEDLQSISKISDCWYSFRGILFSKGTPVNYLKTNLNKGTNLIIKNKTQKVEKIKLSIYTSNSSALQLFIHDFKFRPLVRGKNISKKQINKAEYSDPYIKNPQFLQSNTFCLNWRKNNNQEKNDLMVDNFIQNYLLPYQQKLVSIPLTPYIEDKQV